MPSPRCVITGLAVLLDGAWTPADLFDAGEYWLVNGNFHTSAHGGGIEWFQSDEVAVCYSKTITIVGDFWERRAVFLVHKSSAVLNQAALDYINPKGK